MAQRLVLHIGSMKSGTSFVQNVLGHHKDQLAEAGLLFPGARWKSQVNAVSELIATGPQADGDLPADGHWQRLAEEIRSWDGDAVVSMEFLGPRTADQIARIAAEFPGTAIEAVMTCRDLGRNIPAMWLESTQNGSTTGWADFLDAVRTDDRASAAGRNFWRHQGLPAIARRWAGALGHDRLTLVTVPRPGAEPDLLWRRMAGVLGVEAAGYDLDVRANPSIGLATAQLLLQLNRRMVTDEGTQPPGYDKFVKHVLAKRGLVARQGSEPKLGLDQPWVVNRGEQQLKRLRSEGYRVVGDLDELRPEAVRGVHADDVETAELLDAAVDGIAHLVTSWTAADKQSRRALRRAQRKAGS